ncbi:S1C family serine protease [Clostridium kluyveri]|uniref:S1C family serine protease n=1 Tax=Clostridium kluyveri TaxID=1534 RepID=UPI00224636AC|nr:trypsin-like peptidase domain-containing protein [Clostridium kluyveri]UZQ51781.1 S1C family serine protease [Clostridium kluyveri]
MKKNKNFVISLIITIIVICCGVTLCFLIHKNISLKTSKNSSKLADIEDVLSSSKPKDLKTIIHENEKLVVSLDVEKSTGKVTGSGFLYNTKGDIITNAHVIDGASSITVKMSDTTTYKGTLIGKSDVTDVALVRVDKLKEKTPMKISKSSNVDIGDEIIAMGSPLGLQNTATIGIISGLNRDFYIENYEYKGAYQISAPISSGNSGGPLLDKTTGEVIGINSAKSGNESIGFSIPITQILPLVNTWADNPIAYTSSSENTDKSYTEEHSNLSTEDAAYLVSYFYNNINSQDYVTAYSLLGSSWQESITYDNFRKDYIETLSVKIDTMTCGKLDNGNIQVSTTIQATQGTKSNSTVNTYNIIYNVGYENNVLKILSGKTNSTK